MPEAVANLYNNLTQECQQEVYDFMLFLTQRQLQPKKPCSPIDLFFGTVSDEDSEKMLEAVKDCRRIELNEW